ncbi:MAG: AAA family ATPase [Bacteroidales bacterium]|nr:AAA family ATPase [Bacteroidales bacterium]
MPLPFKKYPIGIYTFEEIVGDNYLYVDKTAHVYNITHNFKYVFLSRPRRFGKSLLVNTLQCYFEARKDLFEGKALAQMETEWVKHPVLRFDMSSLKNKKVEYVESGLDTLLLRYEKEYGIVNPRKTFGDRLQALINAAVEQTGQKVVLLIDEYDSPMLEVFHDKEKLSEVRSILTNFYGPIKICDAQLRFGFITGITKFSQMGIFSGINNLMDISMLDDYSDICGISKEELLTQCKPDIESMAEKMKCSYSEMAGKLTEYYDGYHFSKNSKDIFNPFSLIKAFATKELSYYWYNSGTPTFLFEQLRHFKTRLADLDGQKVMESSFSVSPEVATSALPLLYQSGYLTIKDYDQRFIQYTLGYPNKEVRIGFLDALLPSVADVSDAAKGAVLIGVTTALEAGDVDAAMESIKAFIASMPYHYDNTKEADFQTIMYIIFSLLGMYVKVEVSSAIGRADAIVETKDYVYIIEYKLNKSAEEALRQIDEKGYATPYLSDPRKLIKVGMNFSSELRGLESWMTA